MTTDTDNIEVQTAIPPILYRIPEAAKAFRYSVRTIYNLIKDDGLPFVMVGNVMRIPVRGAENWVAERTQTND